MANHAAIIRQEQGGSVNARGRHWLDFGSRRVFTIDPLHYGNDQEIDTTWLPDVGAWQWKLEENDFQVHARDFLNAGNVIEWLDTRSGESITVQPLGLNWVDNVTDSRQQIALPQAVQATADDCVLYWENGYGTGAHFRYTAHPVRLVKHFIIDVPSFLPTPTVSNPFLEVEFIISPSAGAGIFVDGVEWNKQTKTNTGNRLEFRNGTTVLWYFDAPSAQDANGEQTGGIFQLRKQGNNLYCTVRIDKAWVDGATFPIEIDPTFTDGNGGDTFSAYDTYTDEGSPTNTNHNSTNISNRENSGLARIVLLKFDVSSISGVTVNSASLNIYNNITSTSTRNFNVYDMKVANSGWLEECTWNYADGASVSQRWAGDTGADGGSDAGCSVSGTDYDTTSIGSITYTADTAAGTLHTASLTVSVAQAWVDGVLYGLVFRAGQIDGLQWVSAENATTTTRPSLVIDYTAATTLSVDIGPTNNTVQGVKVVG